MPFELLLIFDMELILARDEAGIKHGGVMPCVDTGP